MSVARLKSLLRDLHFGRRDVCEVVAQAVGVALGHLARSRRQTLLHARRTEPVLNLHVQRIAVLHDDAGTVARRDGDVGLKLGAHRIIVRNPVAAKRIEHASPKVKLSEGPSMLLLGFHNVTSLDQGSDSVWMGLSRCA
jgi:hypothetical protein